MGRGSNLTANHRLPIQNDAVSHGTQTYFCTNRYFAREVAGNSAQFLSCGEAAYAAILNAMLDEATRFIWIADWQMAFDVELAERGPGNSSAGDATAPHRRQLIKVIGELIEKRPIEIRILLFCSPSDHLVPFTKDGMVAKKINALNRAGNKGKVIVLTQPATSTQVDSLTYSHHQKFVVVNGQVGFLGGIDLTYGRYDTAEFDVVIDPATRVLGDMYNPCLTALRPVSPDEQSLIDQYGFCEPYHDTVLEEGCQPRMPWQDVHVQLKGPAVVDMHRNFIRRWNATLHLMKDSEFGAVKALSPTFVWACKAYRALFKDRFATPAQESPEAPAIIDYKWLRHYGVETLVVNAQTKEEGSALVQIVRSVSSRELELEYYDGTQPNPPDDLRFYPDIEQRDVMKKALLEWKDKHQDNILDAMLNCIKSAECYIYIESQFFISNYGASARMSYLRTPWGKMPFSPTPESVSGNEGRGVENRLAEALAERIEYHIAAGNPFHVYLVLPAHPEGSIADPSVWKQQYLALATIGWARDSLIGRIMRSLQAHGRPPTEWSQYLTVLNLRNYGVTVQYARDPKTYREDFTQEIGRYVVTEQVYVHSKTMIVDDVVAIVGSANCNDRSLTGNGDTELAAVIVDGDVELRDLGNPKLKRPTRKFARELRQMLWRKHLGLDVASGNYFASTKRAERANVRPHPLPQEAIPPRNKTEERDVAAVAQVSTALILDQPCNPAVVKAIQKISGRNARIYEKVFPQVPRNGMRDFQDIAKQYRLPYQPHYFVSAQQQVRQANATRDYVNRSLDSYGNNASHEQIAQERRKADVRREKAIESISQSSAIKNSLGVVPPPLTAEFMTTQLQAFQAQAAQEPMENFHRRYALYEGGKVHNIAMTMGYLRTNVIGFFVEAPLWWGAGSPLVRDPTKMLEKDLSHILQVHFGDIS
mgnify:FL=1